MSQLITFLYVQKMQTQRYQRHVFPHTFVYIAEPTDAQIGELGNNVFQMYQFICISNDEKVLRSGRIFNYMNEHLFTKNDPAINEHHYGQFPL